MAAFKVYKTDNWHTHASREEVGVFSSHRFAVRELKKHFDTVILDSDAEDATYENKADMISDLIHNLKDISQTQGFPGGEFVIEEIIITNKLQF